MKKIIISHPTGNASVRATASCFLKAGILEKFFTTLASFDGGFLHQISKIGLLADIQRRTYDKNLKQMTTTQPFYEIGRLISSKLGLDLIRQHEKGIFSIDNVYGKLDKYVAEYLKNTNSSDTVYCYEDGASQTFIEAKKRNYTCLYDLPIGYWRSMHRMLEAEKNLHPEWASTIMGFYDSNEKLKRKDNELSMADHVFVASSFTADTLKDYPGSLAPVSIIPYGFPPVALERQYYSFKDKRPLKVLFVGHLSQRKGIANLFEAVAPFGNRVQLTIVGEKVVKNCQPLNVALNSCKWIPSLSQAEILQLMQQHDVLAFPSLFEGFGLVITEAMSQGTPVITTERTAGPDLIQHNENGWLVEAGNTEALKTAIEKLLLNPLTIKSAGEMAMRTAAQRPWHQYGKELIDAIDTL